MRLPISAIEVHERVRKDPGDITGLADNMQKYGQLSPIVVTPSNELVAGYRRLMAARQLGWDSVEVTVVEHESEIEKIEMELGENIYRKDFTPEELLDGYRRLEELRRPPTTMQKIKAFFRRIFSFLPFVRGKKQGKKPETASPPESENE